MALSHGECLLLLFGEMAGMLEALQWIHSLSDTD